MSEPVVRISQGFFEPQRLADVKARLIDGKASLEPAIRALNGLLHYYVSVDDTSNSMVNVSVWESLEHAGQMDTLAEMQAQRDLFVNMDVKFQPIRNYRGLWSIERSTTQSVIDRYFSGWRRRDAATIAGTLSPTVSFKGPMLTTQGRENFMAAVNALLPLIVDITFRHLFVQGDRAVAIYDFACGDIIGVCRMAELIHVNDGLIQSSEIFMDARPFETALA